MGNQINNVVGRLIYENAYNAAVAAFGESALSTMKLTDSYLRLEQNIVAGKTQYNFPILVNNSSQTNTEQRLNLQDSFVVAQFGFFVANPSGATDAAYILQTFPDPIVFATAGAAGAMQVLYNGNISLTVNNNVLIPAWDTYRHYVVNQTQASASLKGQNNAATDSFYPWEPNIILVGSNNNQFSLQIPAAVATVEPDSRIVLYARGILIQNSTNVV